MEARNSPKRITFGIFEADLQAGELRKNGMKVRLRGQPFDILAMLLERPGEVVTREELQQRLWPDGTFVDFDHSLNTAINKIREALDDSAENPRFVETIPRRGYRFIAPVSGLEPKALEGTTSKTAPETAENLGIDDIDSGRAAAVSPTIPVTIQRRKRALLFGASVLLLLFLSLAGWFIGKTYFRSLTPETKSARFVISLPSKKPVLFPRISPDGQKLAIFDGATIWIRPLDSMEAYSLLAVENASDLFWSSDSGFIAFWDVGVSNAKLKKIAITGGIPKTICEISVLSESGNYWELGHTFGFGTWNREGIILFERGEEPKGLSQVSAEGGTTLPVTALDKSREETDHVSPTFLPDGRHFLYAVRSRKSQGFT